MRLRSSLVNADAHVTSAGVQLY